eukprot:GHVN01047810.1.p2 GENE.GHVN01047810.1~~GHVN01047810.1.p2  ORF type:complete len:133 (-),score=38.10 GHVN01047810.1:1882-2280(-)
MQSNCPLTFTLPIAYLPVVSAKVRDATPLMVPTATNPTSSLSPLPDGPFTTSTLVAIAEPGVEGSSTDPSVSDVSINISDEACEEEVRQHSIAFLEELPASPHFPSPHSLLTVLITSSTFSTCLDSPSSPTC